MLATRVRIEKCALKLFAKQGIKQTSTAQITQKAGIATGTLFVHFKTKQELIDSLYLNIKETAFSGFEAIIQANSTMEEKVKAIAKRVIEYFLRNYHAFVFLELVETDPLVSEEKVDSGYEQLRECMTWTNKGHAEGIDVTLIHQLNWNVVKTIIKFLKKNNQKEVDEKLLTVVWNMLRCAGGKVLPHS